MQTIRSVLLLLAAGCALRAAAPSAYVLHNARIVRVSGATIEKGNVVIRNGTIEAVGENLKQPPDAWVIEAEGLTVYPGFIDALSGWGIPGAAQPPTAGPAGRGPGRPAVVAPAPTPGPTTPPPPPARGPEDRPLNASYVRAADILVPTDNVIQTARDGGFTTAVVYPVNNIFCGQGAVVNLAGEKSGDMVVSAPVGQFLTLKTNGFTSFPGSLMGAIAYIRQVYLDADHYKKAREIYAAHPTSLQRPAYDRTLEGVLDSPRALLPARRAVEIDRMLRFAQSLKLNFVLYGGDEAWRSVDALHKANAPVLVSLKWPERAKDADPADNDSVRILEYRDKAPGTPAALVKSGVRFAFYSDGITNIKDIRKAIRKSLAAGLTADQAVRALTLSPAEIYGISDRLGSIDAGKIANLVITDGSWFEDKTKVKFVFVDGVKFEPLPDEKKPDDKKDEKSEGKPAEGDHR